MVKGYKDDTGKFHPIRKYNKVRRKRSSSTIQGIKIIKKTSPKSPDTKIILRAVKQSLSEQPKNVRDKISSIIIKNKQDSEDFVAKVDTNTGQVTINHKPNLTEGEYKALADHEFEHIDFNDKLQQGNKKYEHFIEVGNKIRPFTPDLIATLMEQEDAFIEGNFGILPDKVLEYPDEINSVIIEIETRQKLGLPTEVLDEQEFRKAKRLVDDLHRKKRDGIRKAVGIRDFDEPTDRFLVIKTKVTDIGSKKFVDEANKQIERGNFIETANLGEAIKAVDEGRGSIIVDRETRDVLDPSLKKRDTQD